MAPPRTVGSWALMRHSTPSTTPIPTIERGPDVVLGAPGGQGAQLEERRVPVEEQLDALAGQQLAPLPVPLRRSARRRRPGPRPAARRPGGRPRSRARALARKVSEFGSMVVERTGMGGGCVLVGVAGCGRVVVVVVGVVAGSGAGPGARSHRSGRRGKNRPMTCAPRDGRYRRSGVDRGRGPPMVIRTYPQVPADEWDDDPGAARLPVVRPPCRAGSCRPWCWPPAKAPGCARPVPSPCTGCADAPWCSTSSTRWPSCR